MVRASLKNLAARKLRLAMSAFAIVLGVAFVAGTYVFTDTLDRSFAEIVTETVPDVTVRPTSNGGGGTASGFAAADARTVSSDLVDRLAAVDGVARADGNVFVEGVFVVGRDGKVVAAGGAPGLGVNWHDGPAADGSEPLSFVAGRDPRTPGEVAIDESTADKAGLTVGDRVSLVTNGAQPRLDAEVVGVVQFGSSNNLVGATLTVFDTRSAQDLFFAGEDVFTDVAITLADDNRSAEVIERIEQALPAGFEAIDGEALAAESQDQIAQGLSFFNTFLLIFAAVALVVGSFLILNTFSILVAQRTQELALFRALGASRRQITGSVLIEALIVGVVGATLGLLLGVGLASGLKALFGLIGLDLSDAGLVFLPRTAIVAYLVGILVTVVAAYVPARRAARVPPVAAMRDDVSPPEHSMHLRMVAGGVLTAAGVAALVGGLAGSGTTGAGLVGAGILGVLLGITLLSPVIGRPVVHVLGASYPRLFGAVGRLARENALRNPRRTAATASALMIGLALVSTMAVLGQSTKRSIDELLASDLRADYVVSNVFGMPFSPAIADDIEEIDGVDTVARFRIGVATVEGSTMFVSATDPAAFRRVVDWDVVVGSDADLKPGQVMVEESHADRYGLAVGDPVEVTWPGGVKEYAVGAIFRQSPMVGNGLVMTLEDLAGAGIQVADSYVYVAVDAAADRGTVRGDIEAAVADLPTVTLKDQAAFAEEQRAPIDQLLAIVYALLGLAIVIAVLGIVNTLALSVIERTHEVGLLRAVGMSRRQLRTMVRLESVVIAVLGAVLGVVLGIAFGVTLQRAIADQGIEVLSIPYGQLIAFVALAALVGVLAAVWPARRAARLDVLQAIATE